MEWNRRPALRWGLRQLGVVLLLASYASGKHLALITHARAGDPPLLAYLLALTAFLGLSSGAALVIHGHHLFEKVAISDRWRRLPPPADRLPTPRDVFVVPDPSLTAVADRKLDQPPRRAPLAQPSRSVHLPRSVTG
jgi:hypothetical protein